MIHIDNIYIEQHESTAVTIGNFDGIHLGHFSLVEEVKKQATLKGLKSIIFSFYPHPKTIITGKPIKHILLPEEKLFILKEMSVNTFIEYPFNKEFAKYEPEYFIKEILVKKLKCKVLVVGEDYKLGRKQSGNISNIKQIARKFNIEVIVIKHKLYKNKKISSSNIRNLILKGKLSEVNQMLSKAFFIKGRVNKGNQIGRTIGFPTANIFPHASKILPPNGVYITKTNVIETNEQYYSITNIGISPTVNGIHNKIETFLFNFNGNLYNKDIIVSFYEYIRREKKFNSLEELKEQIKKDIYLAKSTNI